jgi:hypothetical protein
VETERRASIPCLALTRLSPKQRRIKARPEVYRIRRGLSFLAGPGSTSSICDMVAD